MSTHTVPEHVHTHANLYSEANRFVHSSQWEWRGEEKKHFEDGRAGARETGKEIFPQNCSAYPPSRRELGFWTPASVVWFSPAWLCVSSSGPWLCAQGPLQSLYEQTTWRDQREGGKRGHRLRHISSDFSVIHHWLFCCCFVKREKKRKKKTKHIRAQLGSRLFSPFFFFLFPSFFFFLHFPVDLNFSWADMLCGSPATPTVLNSSGSNTSRAQPINHRGAWQTNHLLMKRGSHEFLTAFVLFIKPDQTMKIQTSLKGNGGSRRE